MRKFCWLILVLFPGLSMKAQTIPTELQKLVTSFIADESEDAVVGDWAVGEPSKYDVKWSTDKLESGNDPNFSFFRNGMTSAYYRGKTLLNSQKPISWAVTLRGPKEGYTSYSIASSPSSELNDFSIESIFSKDAGTWNLLSSCDEAGKKFRFYEVHLPGKTVHYIKISLIPRSTATAIRIDGYDAGSKELASTDCQ